MIYPNTAPITGSVDSPVFRYGGSTTPVEGDPVMILDSGRRVAGLPMNGFKITEWVASDYYPFLLPLELDAELAGGLGITYWWRTMRFFVRVRYAASHRTIPATVSFDHTFEMGRNSSEGLNDERDLVDRGVYFWVGGSTQGTPFAPGSQEVTAFLEMFPPPNAPNQAEAAIPYSWLVCGESLAPAFALRIHLNSFAGFSTQLHSYRYVNFGRAFAFGTGSLDGMPFFTYAEPGPDWEVLSLAVEVIRILHFQHGGLYNPDTGGYAAGKTTNRYKGP